MKKNALVKISKKYLVFREDAKRISGTIQKKVKSQKIKSFCLDFSEARFFSRSFVDELLNIIGSHKEKKTVITPINLDVNLKKLFDKVKKRKKEIKKII